MRFPFSPILDVASVLEVIMVFKVSIDFSSRCLNVVLIAVKRVGGGREENPIK